MVQSAAAAAQYNYDIVKKFAIMALVWGLLGMSAGTYIAAELAFPFLNFDIAEINFGRLRPVHTTLVIFGFGGSALFAIVYWIWYPAWPIAGGYTKGISRVTFESGGEEVTMHWNTRAELIKEMQTGRATRKQQAYLEKVSAASYEQIANDPDMVAFTRSMAKVLFADNCAACHGAGGTPAQLGQYPNLRDDAWL